MLNISCFYPILTSAEALLYNIKFCQFVWDKYSWVPATAIHANTYPSRTSSIADLIWQLD